MSASAAPPATWTTEGLPPGQVPLPPASWLRPGDQAGHWTIAGLIGEGGCGAVYAARHRVLERPAAIKVLHYHLVSNPAIVWRFVSEARTVNRVRHPNIADIFDFGQLSDGCPYFAMELLAPGDLHQRIEAGGPFSAIAALCILAPIGRALAAAHAAGVIHRDLKARNIGFLPLSDGRETVKLLDFGIAKLIEPGSAGAPATARLGTLHAMPPEQILGLPVDERTDVYALGALLHHMVTGRIPYLAEDPLEMERLHLEAPPPRPSQTAPVPRGVDELVRTAMAKSPADRPPNAPAFIEALRRAVGALPPSVESYEEEL